MDTAAGPTNASCGLLRVECLGYTQCFKPFMPLYDVMLEIVLCCVSAIICGMGSQNHYGPMNIKSFWAMRCTVVGGSALIFTNWESCTGGNLDARVFTFRLHLKNGRRGRDSNPRPWAHQHAIQQPWQVQRVNSDKSNLPN